MNFRMIEALEKNTPACSVCSHDETHFVIGHAYQLLKCDWCGIEFKAPQALTNLILAAYQLKVGGGNRGKRLVVVPLEILSKGKPCQQERRSR